MKFRVTLETAILVTKYGVAPIACWPLPPDATTFDIWRRNFHVWFSFTLMAFCGSLSIYKIYESADDPEIIVTVLSELVALLSTAAKMVICRKEATSLQVLFTEVQMFMATATQDEMELIQLYVDKCIFPHSLILIGGIFGPILFITGPLFTSTQSLPATTAFPFSTEQTWIWASLYVGQSYLIIQVGCMAIVDFIFAILLWFTGARFEMLNNELEWAKDTYDVRRCIRKHQELLEFTDRVKVATRSIALEVTVVGIFSVTTGGFVLIQHPSFYVLAKYIVFDLVFGMELFLLTWPADNLMDMSEKIGFAAYSCAWIGKSTTMRRDLRIIMQKSQIPMVIAVKGVLPALSLELYGSVLSASFSYITALRTFTNN